MKNKTKFKKKTVPQPKNNKFFIGLIVILVISFLFYIIYSNLNVERKTTPEKRSSESTTPFNKQGEVSFIGIDGEFKTRIDVEISDTEYKRNLGLMYRDKMDEYQGMLFIFPEEEMLSFWMKNTILPLDIVFIDKDFKIINIHKNTIPHTLGTYEADSPAQYVVEVNAGFTDKYHIQKGDKINWRAAK